MRSIDVKEMERMLDDATVINVLPRESFEQARIPGSINIPESDSGFLDKVRQEVPAKDADVVVYCADEDCQASPRAAQRLVEDGYINVHDFEGGLKAWRRAGHPLEGERRTQMATSG